MKALASLAPAAVLLLAGCGPTSRASGGRPGTGDLLLNVPLYTLDGKRTSLARLAHGRVVAFEFGATWCEWCNTQLEQFEKVIDKYGADVLVLDIDVQEPAATVRKHYAEHKFRTPVVLDPKGYAAARYGVEGLPALFVADRNGRILHRGSYAPFADLEPLLDEALKTPAKPAPSRPRSTVQ